MRIVLGAIAALLVGRACTLARLGSVVQDHGSLTEGHHAWSAPSSPSSSAASATGTDGDGGLLDSWSMAAREDGAACRKALADAGYRFRALPDTTAPDKNGCGIPHPVILFRGPSGIVYDPPITVDCSFARALGSVERIVQEEARTHLRAAIAKIAHLGAYACRPRNFRKGAALSAHAFGSALDVAAFHPSRGVAAIVERDFDEPRSGTSAPRWDRHRFLQGLFTRLRRHEADLTYVVGPGFDANHHNHFHLDRGGWQFWFSRGP